MAVQKRGRGRPRREDAWTKTTLNLSLETIVLMQEIGGGKLGAGIERVAKALRRTMAAQQKAEEKAEKIRRAKERLTAALGGRRYGEG